MVEVGDLHLGAIGGVLADDGGVEGSHGGGAVLLDTGAVGLLVAAVASVAGGARGTAATVAGVVVIVVRVGAVVASRAVSLLGLDDIIKGHIESGHSYDSLVFLKSGKMGCDGFVC